MLLHPGYLLSVVKDVAEEVEQVDFVRSRASKLVVDLRLSISLYHLPEKHSNENDANRHLAKRTEAKERAKLAFRIVNEQ